MNEIQVLSTIDDYRTYLEKECSCDVSDFANFYQFLSQSPNQVLFLSSPQRMNLIVQYLKLVHQFDLVLEEQPLSGNFSKVFDHERADILDLKLYTFRVKH